MLRNANNVTPHDSRSNVLLYPKLGYVPTEGNEHSGCSETLEYSYNDFGISQVGKLLNETEATQ
jgi:putative alpha-1,2-mannosidase